MSRFCGLVLLVLAAITYTPFLDNLLVFDDFNVINGTSFLDYTFQFSFTPRWFPYATLAHSYVLFDGSIVAMRLGNMILHVANAIAVYVLLREAYLSAVDKGLDAHKQESGALLAALVAAALFVVNPVAVYGVGYLVQRSILMSTLFMLLMLIAYLRWLVSGRTSLWIWSVVWYFLSIFSKEHSVAAPAVALVLTFVVHRPSFSVLRRLIAPFAAYLAIALVVVSIVKGVLGVAYEPYALDMIKEAQTANDIPKLTYPLSVATQVFLFFKYMFLWAFPNVSWMSLDMRTPMATSPLAWPYVGAIAGFICYALGAMAMVIRGGRAGLAGWILLYPWIMFATELSTIRVQEPFVLYRAYLWFPLFGALLPLVATRLNAKFKIGLAIPVLCVLMALSWNRLHTLSDALLTWDDAAKLLVTGKEPGADRIYYNRALALSTKRRHIEALADLDRTLLLNTAHAPVYLARAQVNFKLKRYDASLQDLNAAIALDPKQSSYYLARAITVRQLGHREEALVDLRTSCSMKDAMACYVLGRETSVPAAKR